jgi:hypothetical protein
MSCEEKRTKNEKKFDKIIEVHTNYIRRVNQDDLVQLYSDFTSSFMKGQDNYHKLIMLIKESPRLMRDLKLFSFQKSGRYPKIVNAKPGNIVTTDILSTTYSEIAVGVNSSFSDMGAMYTKYMELSYKPEQLKKLIKELYAKEFSDLIIRTNNMLERYGENELVDKLNRLIASENNCTMSRLIDNFQAIMKHSVELEEDRLYEIESEIEENEISEQSEIDLRVFSSKIKMNKLLTLHPIVNDIIDEFISVLYSLNIPKKPLPCCLLILHTKTKYLFIEKLASPDVKKQKEVILSPRTWRVRKVGQSYFNVSYEGWYNCFQPLPSIFKIQCKTMWLDEIG